MTFTVSVPIKEGKSETHLNTNKKALKLHQRFAHAKSKRIIKFLENAGKKDKDRKEVVSIREQLEMKEVQEVKWIPSELQLADGLTKGTASPESLIHVLTTGQFNNNL